MLALLFAAALLVPDAKLTPGVADQSVTQATIGKTVCVPLYTSKVRNVPASEKLTVFREYAVNPKVGGPYEIDHLISLEIGGANDIRNLWPEAYSTKPLNAHTKDALENRLHKLVCNGTISLKTAQSAISGDWRIAYVKYYGPLPK